MPPNTVQTGPVKHKGASLISKINILIIAVVVIAVVAGSLWYHHSHSTSSNGSTNTYKYTYSQLTPFSVTGQGNGAIMDFSRPNEIGTNQGTTTKGSSVVLSQTVKNFVIAQISAFAQVGPDQVGTDVAAGKTNLNDRTSSGFLSIVSPSQHIVANLFDPAYGFDFASTKAFTNPYIKSNAWEMDFSAHVPGPADSTLPDEQGTVIMALGANTIYYFEVNVVKTNWQSNQPVWNQVLNSIKIDQ